MYSHTKRLLFATLALLIGLSASACSKKKGEPQTDVPSAQSTTAGSTHDHPMDPGMKDHDHPMDPAMKDRDRRMGPGMEGDANEHDREHP